MAAEHEPGKPETEFYGPARALAEASRVATLATAEAGRPHAALVTLAWLPGLRPLLLLSELAVHTRQLRANPACALLLTGAPAGENPQTTPRLCLGGRAAKSADAAARGIFLQAHPYAGEYADFADFAFWEVAVTDAYSIAGFGAARHLDPLRLAG